MLSASCAGALTGIVGMRAKTATPLMKPFPKVRLAPGTPLLTERQFALRGLLYWVYALCWLAALYWLGFLLKAPWLVKGLLVFLLATFTPDVQSLFWGYESYKELWEASQCSDSPPKDDSPHNT